MGAFKRILVAVDGSESSDRAVDMAKRLCGEDGAHITLVHVVQPIYQAVGAYGYASFTTMLELQEETGRTILTEAKDMLEGANVTVDERLVIGNRGEEICNLAKEGEYDLIVMGRRGVSRLEEVVLGSVSSYVVHHSHLPVLIVQ